jgi:hypothetical protein
MSYRAQLSELLAGADDVILEARSHVTEPGDDTESVVDAAKVLEDMEAVRERIEAKLQQ